MAGSSPLVDADWVLAHLEDPTVRIVHLLYEPDIDDYTDGHIPGAVVRFWKDFLWHPVEREFADPDLVAERLGAAGVRPSDTLVLYSGRAQYAMYGYWILHVMNGHRDVRVLDGGRTAWLRAGHPMTTAVPDPVPVPYRSGRDRRDDSSRIRRDELRARLGRPGVRILDARTPEEYRGERVKPAPGPDHGAERGGHIPGALNLHARNLQDPTDFTLRPRDELEALFRSVGAAPDQAEEVITYCRLSHRGSALWFAMTQVLGWSHARVYDGSWTEWGSSVGMPIER